EVECGRHRRKALRLCTVARALPCRGSTCLARHPKCGRLVTHRQPDRRLSFWSSTTFRTTSTVPPTMLRQSADAKMKEGERRGVGRATPILFEGRKLLGSGARHERRSKIIAGKAVRAVNRVRGSDALEPLKQSQRLWMICETVECYWERRIGG